MAIQWAFKDGKPMFHGGLPMFGDGGKFCCRCHLCTTCHQAPEQLEVEIGGFGNQNCSFCESALNDSHIVDQPEDISYSCVWGTWLTGLTCSYTSFGYTISFTQLGIQVRLYPSEDFEDLDPGGVVVLVTVWWGDPVIDPSGETSGGGWLFRYVFEGQTQIDCDTDLDGLAVPYWAPFGRAEYLSGAVSPCDDGGGYSSPTCTIYNIVP